MSNQIKLLSYGHMPVYLEVDNATYLKLIKGQLKTEAAFKWIVRKWVKFLNCISFLFVSERSQVFDI